MNINFILIVLSEKFNIQGFGDKTMAELLILLPFNMTVILSLVPGFYRGGGWMRIVVFSENLRNYNDQN